jgi:hypothetical protein
MAGALMAGSINPISVTLPHAVTVGSTVLPSGQYTMTSADTSDGNEYFVLRGAHTPTVTLPARKIASDNDATRVVLSQDGETWRFQKLFVSGGGAAYEFVNTK